MIQHQPYGIDDPYKRLPAERVPRDPEPGDPVQIGFQTGPETTHAWVMLEGRETIIEARFLGGGLWIALLEPVSTGTHRYRIYAQSSTGTETAGPFAFEVGRWCRATRVLEVNPIPNGVTIRLETDHRPSAAWIALSFPTAGACRLEFSTLEAPKVTGLPCQIEQDARSVRLGAEGIEIELDLSRLDVRARHPSQRDWRVHAAAAVRWLETVDGLVTRLETQFTPGEGEALYGLGERFDAANKRGQRLDVRVYEEYKEQGERTYMPVPFVVSSGSYGLWLDALEPSVFDLRGETCTISLEKLPTADARLALNLIVAERPYGVTSVFTRLTGEIAVPPKWAFGPWMSSNDWNSQAKTEAVVRRTVVEDVPASALVLEAWSDESTFYVFHDAQYEPKSDAEAFRLKDFTFAGRWPNPKGLVNECHDHGIRVLLWQIPVYRASADANAPAHTRAQHQADQSRMIEGRYSVLEEDSSAYRCKGWWFTDGLVMDFTNPQARDWWFAKRRYLFDDLGIDGMKTDGGEHLWGRDLRLHNGQRGLEMFNGYPNTYVGAYHDFIREHTGGDGLTFSRAGFTGAQRFPAHWAGDENSTWSAYKASIQAGLSAGLCGISMWAWDIGGFSGDIPNVELYLRSTAMACFCPIMQYHSEFNSATENRDRSPWNISERHNDPRALEVYRHYAKLRMRLLDTIYEDAQTLSLAGTPLMRYPQLEYPEARGFLESDPQAYLFGRDLLVCPVVEKGAVTRDVSLPPGEWIDLWSGAAFDGLHRFTVPAPLERIPVFVRADSARLSWWLEIGHLCDFGSVRG